jgi:hypothetical protein
MKQVAKDIIESGDRVVLWHVRIFFPNEEAGVHILILKPSVGGWGKCPGTLGAARTACVARGGLCGAEPECHSRFISSAGPST